MQNDFYYLCPYSGCRVSYEIDRNRNVIKSFLIDLQL
jgi:hypothetical protein